MRRSFVILFALVATACGHASAQSPAAAVIPRYAGVPDTGRAAAFRREMNYDPDDRALAWPDSTTIFVAHLEGYSSADVFSSTCGGSGIFRVSIATRTAQPVGVGAPACSLLESPAGLALAPDGRWAIGDVYAAVNRRELLRVTLPQGPADTLRTTCAVYAEAPDVSPDATRIAFVGQCRDRQQPQYEIYVVDVDGSALRRVPGVDGVTVDEPRWSPDGKRIAYTSSRGGGRSVEIPEVDVVDLDGRGRRVLARGSEPAWSPDGEWVAYLGASADRDAPRELRVVRATGDGDRLVFRNAVTSTFRRGWGPIREGQPRGRLVWSPDGRWIAFSRGFNVGTSVWRVHVRTGELVQVTRREP